MRGCSCRGTAGFAHVSCLAEQAKILVAEAEENNLGAKAFNERWARWDTCRLCEQQYHGVVGARSGGPAGRRTWVGRRLDWPRQAGDEPAWERFIRCRTPRGRFVRERGRIVYAAAHWRNKTGAILGVQGNLARTYLERSDGKKRPCKCSEMYTLNF